MDEHTLALLEFGRIVEELKGLCLSPHGAATLAAQPVLTTHGEVSASLALTRAFREILDSAEPLPSLDFPDIRDLLPRLGKQGIQLEGEELAAVGRTILSALVLARHVQKSAPAGPLAAIAGRIPDLGPTARAIFRVVDGEGALRERQLPELAAIRDRIRRGREDVERSARALLDEHSSRPYWQSPQATLRDGRVVLPLKTQFKGRVRGIVHEMSASGSTLFIEPLEIVEKNNAVVEEENLYRLEVRRLLRELTSTVSAHASEIADLVEASGLLDTILARARFAVQHRCWEAEYAPGAVRLREARHPLLGPSVVVPVSVSAGAGDRILIVTGPNTGGKTVSLKTVGLLAVMNQFGMQIPAAEGSGLEVFEGIYADIGDEQSLEQSLSTFSGHVKNLAGIVAGAGARSLVLLDELGAGTDPEEGVALAMALLDHFLQAGCIVLATTHHGILKNYGATRPGVQNASMGFDRESLAPTYRILMGVPGESHALEIARRTGIPGAIIENAAAYLNDERTDISDLVSNLADRHQRLAQAEEEQQARETVLREKRRTTDLKELTLRQKELELRRHGLKELRDFLEEARRQWEGLRERPGAASGKEFGQLASAIRDRIEAEEERIRGEQESLVPPADFEVREGMEVVIRRSGRRGTVVRRDKANRWVVETETLRLSLLAGELAPAGQGPASELPPPRVSYSTQAPIDLPAFELHLRGMRVEEALRALERQIDSALVHGLKEFSVIHGKGEGILRTAVHDHLRALPAVADFRFSVPEEGGYGKTIVTLKG